jgi:hypothetical protein
LGNDSFFFVRIRHFFLKNECYFKLND